MESVSKLRIIKDRVLTLAIFVITAASVAPMLHIVFEAFSRGLPVIISAGPRFFIDSPPAPGSSELGGIGPVIKGSAAMVTIASLISLPVSILAGTFMAEHPKSILSRLSETISHLLIEFPSIVVSLFVYVVLVVPMGTPSTLAGSVSLAIMMLPYVTIQVCEALRSIPHTYREAAFALGLPRSKAVFYVFFGIARRGIFTGALLGVAKAIGETAPILFTAGSAFHGFYGLFGPSGAIPLLIYKFSQTSYENWQQIAWAATLILIVAVVTAILALKSLVKEVKL